MIFWGCLATLLIVSSFQVQAVRVQCDYGQTTCMCDASVDVCEFEFIIESFQTFIKYKLASGRQMRGTQGEVFYINNGSLLSVRNRNLCLNGTDPSCTDAITVDSSTYRSVIAVNGQVPGPNLIVHENQTVVVDVHNNLPTEGISIHWHGMHQRNTPWMDGVGLISHCPIGPETSFRYIFKAFPGGTFWYHSHSGSQRTDGLYGGLIVMEEGLTNYPLQFVDRPQDHTLLLLDWQREPALDLFTQLQGFFGFFEGKEVDEIPNPMNTVYSSTHAPDNTQIGPIPYWSGIINSRGRHPDVPFASSLLEVFEVEQGSMYRFRLIGAQALYAYRFSVDAHKLTVIAVDGYLTQPIEVDYIVINTGERFDFVLNANQTMQNNYWIRAETLEIDRSHGTARDRAPYDFLDHSAEAILHYSGMQPPRSTEYGSIDSIAKMCSENNPCTMLNCPFEAFHPSYNISCVSFHQLQLFTPTPPSELPSLEPARRYFFNFGFESDDLTSSINGRNFIFPSVPPQTQEEGYEVCNENDIKCTYTVNIPYNETIQFVFSVVGRQGRFSHPIHLHGHSFHVVATGYGEYNNETGFVEQSTRDITCRDDDYDTVDDEICTRPQWRPGRAPNITLNEYTVRKDTIIAPARGYVVIQFISDNPGYWFLHCHVESHQLEGMAMIINEAQMQQNPPPEGIPRCGNFNWTVNDFNEKLRFDPTSESASNKISFNLAVAALLTFLAATALL